MIARVAERVDQPEPPEQAARTEVPAQARPEARSDAPRGDGPPSALDPQLRALYLRVLGGDLGAAQLWFDPAVLDRYRGQAGGRVIRTNSAGRVQAAGGWSLDFGIASADRLIHVSAADVAQRLPPGERAHWAQHLRALPVSQRFLTMRLGGGSCVDDGELRAWPAPAAPRQASEAG